MNQVHVKREDPNVPTIEQQQNVDKMINSLHEQIKAFESKGIDESNLYFIVRNYTGSFKYKSLGAYYDQVQYAEESIRFCLDCTLFDEGDPTYDVIVIDKRHDKASNYLLCDYGHESRSISCEKCTELLI